jgi:succinylglutamate desuccinylase
MFDLTDHYTYFEQNQNSTLPFAIEFDSGVAGLNLVFVGSTHGSEPAGTIANVEIHKQLLSGDLKLKKGKVTFVLGNPAAFLGSKRFVEKNLNRVFREEIASGLEGDRAKEFREYFSSHKVDFLLDLHSVSVGNFQFVIYFHSPETVKTAVDISPIGIHLLADKKTIPGTLIEEVRRHGGEGFVIECGNHNQPQTVDVARYHIISTLLHHDMIEKSDVALPNIEPSPEICVYEVFDTIKPRVGFQFTDPDTTTGTFVKKDHIFVTYDGGVDIANRDCYIVMPDKNPSIHDVDAGFLCTRDILKRSF